MMQDTNDEPKIETNDELKIETNDELKIETDNDCVLHQKSRVFSKVMTFAWLVAHMNVNTNGMLQLRRPFKVLSPNWCIICRRNREMIDDLFLHCQITLGLWHRIFSQVGMLWLHLDNIHDMMVISLKRFKNSTRGKTLWKITCLTLLWIVWRERNVRIFEDNWKASEMMWDLLYFYTYKVRFLDELQEMLYLFQVFFVQPSLYSGGFFGFFDQVCIYIYIYFK